MPELAEPPATVDGDRRKALIEKLTHAAALRGEQLVCVCRFVFCTLVLIRFWALDLHLPPIATGLKMATALAAMGYSVWMLSAIRAGQCTPASLRTSVIADATICCGCLLGTTVWPGFADYRGLLTRPEPMSLLIMIFTSGFRLSPRLALWGGTLNSVGLAVLLLADRSFNADVLRYGPAEIFFFALAVVSVSVLAYATAVITLGLVETVSLEMLRVQGVRSQLTDIIRDQHDAKSLLSTATLNADLVCRSLQDGAGPTSAGQAVTMMRELRHALETLSGAVRRLSERTVDQLTVLREPSPLDAAQVIRAALPALRLHFPSLELSARLAHTPPIQLLGGRGGLERVLFNLVLNATQGDGHHGALHVWISTDATPRSVCIRVEDDGPGFCAEPRLDGPSLSRKPTGSGLGLFGVLQLAEVSGGRLEVGRSARGGAAVALILPIATDPPRTRAALASA